MGRGGECFILQGWEEQKGNQDVVETDGAVEGYFEKQRKHRRNEDDSTDGEGFVTRIPVNPGIDQLLKKGAKPLPVRPVLPAEHLPKRVVLEQSGFVNVPLVRRQNIYRVARDEWEKSPAGEAVGNE